MKLRFKYALIALSMIILSCGSDDEGIPNSTPIVPEEPVTASYTATITTDFSEENFPQDYPSGASFGTIVAITHEPGISIYQLGQMANEGFEAYVENDDVATLEAFLSNQVGEENEGSFTIQSIGSVSAVGSETFNLSFTPTRTRVTIIANLNPSPDWFVGVSSFDITDGNSLIESETIGLLSIDAGISSGDTYEASGEPENAVISTINGAPFSSGGFTPEIGQIEISRVN